jgi:hypothetical protein
LFNFFLYITLSIGIIPLLIIIWKKKALKWHHPTVPYVWLVAIASLYEFIGTVILKINTAYWFQLYSFLSFIAMFYFFYRTLKSDYKTLFQYTMLSFILVFILSFFYWSEENVLLTTAINNTYETLIVIVFTSLWFKKTFDNIDNTRLFEEVEITDLWQSEMFYFVSGLFIYHCLTFFTFLFGNFIYDSNLYFYDYWIVNVFGTIIFRIFLILSVWKMKKA